MSKIKVRGKANEAQGPSKIPKSGEKIKDRDLSAFAHKEMMRYAVSVNEDRAISEYHDGFKPVQRRILWAAYSAGMRYAKPLVKSARLVGETLGKYHPHGDTACYGAIVNMVTARYPLLTGEGNYGTFSEPKEYAAMRYTTVKLSAFSERVFFDPFYMPVMKTVSNYDDQDREPLYLHSMLPNVLFNTTFAIGVATTARIPRFTMASVAKLVTEVLGGEPATVKSCLKHLEFTTQYQGQLAPNQKAALIQLYKTGCARIRYDSPYELDTKAKKMVFVGFAPFSNFMSRVEKLIKIPEVKTATDESDKTSKIGRYAVYFKSNIDARKLPELAKKVAQVFSEPEDYVNNITIRKQSATDPDVADVVLRSTTIPELVNRWCDYRIKLEVEACTYQIKLKDKEIRRIEVMRIAVANRKAIIQALDKKLNDQELATFLAKLLKVSVEEATQILDLRVRQLKALEDHKLIEELKKLKTLRAEYEARRKKPAPYCAQHVLQLVKDLQ